MHRSTVILIHTAIVHLDSFLNTCKRVEWTIIELKLLEQPIGCLMKTNEDIMHWEVKENVLYEPPERVSKCRPAPGVYWESASIKGNIHYYYHWMFIVLLCIITLWRIRYFCGWSTPPLVCLSKTLRLTCSPVSSCVQWNSRVWERGGGAGCPRQVELPKACTPLTGRLPEDAWLEEIRNSISVVFDCQQLVHTIIYWLLELATS